MADRVPSRVEVELWCPSCGADDSVDLEPGDYGSKVSFACKECGVRIRVELDVRVSVRPSGGAR